MYSIKKTLLISSILTLPAFSQGMQYQPNQMQYQQPAMQVPPQQQGMQQQPLMAVQPQDMPAQPQAEPVQVTPVKYVVKKKNAKKVTKKTAKPSSSPKKTSSSSSKSTSKSEAARSVKEPIRVSRKDLDEGILPRPFVSSGTSKASLTISGQINRMVALRYNGATTRIDNLDSTASSSRINVTGSGKADPHTTMDAVIEIEYQDGVGAQFAELGNTPVGSVFSNAGQAMRPRRIEGVFKHDHYGTAFVGMGSTSSDGTAEVDLSGTTCASLGAEGPFDTGGFQYLNNDTDSLSPRLAYDAFNKFDALSRAERIRYDSPSLGGAVVGFTYTNQDQSDQTVKYSAQIGKTKVGAAIAHSFQPFLKVTVPVGIGPAGAANSIPNNGAVLNRASHIYLASFSVLHDGFSVSAALANRHFKVPPVNSVSRKPAKMWFVKAGYQTHLIDCGLSAFAFDFGRAKANSLFENNFAIVNGEHSISYALTAVQNFDSAATEAYFVARRYLLKNGTAKFHDAYVYFLGMRIKF